MSKEAARAPSPIFSIAIVEYRSLSIIRSINGCNKDKTMDVSCS